MAMRRKEEHARSNNTRLIHFTIDTHSESCDEIRVFLIGRNALPLHLVPFTYIEVDSLPVIPVSSKVDREALQAQLKSLRKAKYNSPGDNECLQDVNEFDEFDDDEVLRKK